MPRRGDAHRAAGTHRENAPAASAAARRCAGPAGRGRELQQHQLPHEQPSRGSSGSPVSVLLEVLHMRIVCNIRAIRLWSTSALLVGATPKARWRPATETLASAFLLFVWSGVVDGALLCGRPVVSLLSSNCNPSPVLYCTSPRTH
jgi:hypothetical protein